MSTDADKLLADALQLADNDRAEMASRLIDSLDPSRDDDAQSAWSAEIARRIAALDSGATTAVPWPEARRMIAGNENRFEKARIFHRSKN